MKVKDLLPIGSVVMLKNAEHALMIFGVMQTDETEKVDYDYIGVLYPEGNMGTESQFLFQHESVEKVLFRGWESEEREEFIAKLEEFYENPVKDEV